MMSLQITLPLVVVVAFLAGAVASVTGFGIGSILTPLLALETGTKVSVAVVSIPHFFGTALRFRTLREHVDRQVFLSFGLMSAAGALIGALLHQIAGGPLLTAVLGALRITNSIFSFLPMMEVFAAGGVAIVLARLLRPR